MKTCHLWGIGTKLKHLGLLYRELKREKYDVFQTNIDLFNGPQMLVAWFAGVPVRECHSHNSQQGRELSQGKTLPVRIYQVIMRWMCWSFSNRRCGCSVPAMDFLFKDKWRNDPRAKVIHNGIDFHDYRKEYDKEIIKKKLSFHNTHAIATVGRISLQKNPEFLLDIFWELSKIRDDVDLVWCGKGEDENLIREKINEYNLGTHVKLLGYRSDIPDILCASDLFLLPSRFEGLGIVLIEAQAAGLPCVISEVVPKEVDCGLCLPISLEKDAGYWAAQINKIIDGNISLTLDERKLEKYSIETMITEMEEVFER